MRLELVSFAICPFVQRAVIALKEKEAAFDITYIELDNPPSWFKSISPLGKVPLLKVNGEVLFESSIINEYLDEVMPPRLHPKDALLRAKHRGWIEFASHLLFEQFKVMAANHEDDLDQHLEALGGSMARVVPELSDGPFFSGDDFSLVDAAYAPFFMRIKILMQHHEALEDLIPTPMKTWSEALLERPSVKASVVEDFEQRFIAFGKQRGSMILTQA